MTMTFVIARAVAVAIFRTIQADATGAQTFNRQTLLSNAHFALATNRTVRRQSRVDALQAQIDDGRSARYHRLLVRDETVRQQRHRFHAEFQNFIQMSTLQQTAHDVLLRTVSVRAVQTIVAAVAVPCALQVFDVTLFHRVAGRAP